MSDAKGPLNFRFLQEGFLLAEKLGRTEEAEKFRRLLDQAREEEPGSVPPRDALQLELNQVGRLLYEPPPDGYRRAKERLREILSKMPWAEKDGTFAVYFAAALGQEYEAQKRLDAPSHVLDLTAGEALRWIRTGIALGQSDWLRRLAVPATSTGHASPDDDLVVLARDRAEVRDALKL